MGGGEAGSQGADGGHSGHRCAETGHGLRQLVGHLSERKFYQFLKRQPQRGFHSLRNQN